MHAHPIDTRIMKDLAPTGPLHVYERVAGEDLLARRDHPYGRAGATLTSWTWLGDWSAEELLEVTAPLARRRFIFDAGGSHTDARLQSEQLRMVYGNAEVLFALACALDAQGHEILWER